MNRTEEKTKMKEVEKNRGSKGPDCSLEGAPSRPLMETLDFTLFEVFHCKF